MNETIERENEKLTATARPWELDGCYIMRGTLTVTKALRFQDAALIVRAINEYEALNAVAEALYNCEAMMVTIECGHQKPLGFGAVIDEARKALAALAAIRGGGKSKP